MVSKNKARKTRRGYYHKETQPTANEMDAQTTKTIKKEHIAAGSTYTGGMIGFK